MTTEQRRQSGFPVEVALFDRAITARRYDSGSGAIYAYTFSPDVEGEGIFCEAPGERPGSIAWGMTLDPVLADGVVLGPKDVASASAVYIETTGPELQHLIDALQTLHDVNFGEPLKPQEG